MSLATARDRALNVHAVTSLDGQCHNIMSMGVHIKNPILLWEVCTVIYHMGTLTRMVTLLWV